MHLSGRQRFGLITFVFLLIASILVTWEPWKSNRDMRTIAIPESPPLNILLKWETLPEGYPVSSHTDTIRVLEGFDMGYSEVYEQASWVVYVLTREEVEEGWVSRTDDFRSDTSLITGSASLDDYRGSGFDRGHLAPAGDMKWSQIAMSESFLLSNMSPQLPTFNRGVWRRLEEQVRDWAVEKDSLYVITGPVFNLVESVIGENEVGVPGAYFKVLADLSPPSHSFIAFLLPHEGSSSDLMEFAITVDSLERVTGYDFFARAPNQEVITWLESRIPEEEWME